MSLTARAYVPGATKRAPLRSFASTAGKPFASRYPHTLDLSPLAAGAAVPRMELPHATWLQQVLRAATSGRIDSPAVRLAEAARVLREGFACWDRQLASLSGQVSPPRTRSAQETHAQLVRLHQRALEIHLAHHDDPPRGVAGADEDDWVGEHAAHCDVASLDELLFANDALVVALAAAAPFAHVGLPHPGDLEAILVHRRFADALLGQRRAPSRVSRTVGLAPSLLTGGLSLARRRLASIGPHFEMLEQDDLRVLLMALGWDGTPRDGRTPAGAP